MAIIDYQKPPATSSRWLLLMDLTCAVSTCLRVRLVLPSPACAAAILDCA